MLREGAKNDLYYRIEYHCLINAGFKKHVDTLMRESGFYILDHDSYDSICKPVGTLIFISKVDAELLKKVSLISRQCRVLVIAQPGFIIDEISAMDIINAGASDTFNSDADLDLVSEIKARLERWNLVDQILASRKVKEMAVGNSPLWTALLRQVVEVARFTSDSVLLTGETGTGKELIARLIHDLDARESKGRYVILDCAAIVPELSGSEFFGHERGAFTGAVTSRDGAFALADGGTLFLDEVGDLPANLQAQLLRVIQEGYFRRVGSNTWHQTKFRLVCATNKDLQKAVMEGKFRRDLFYRIANWVFNLPSLQERRDDIPALARHFLKQIQSRDSVSRIDKPVEIFLQKRKYPGNVRELKLLISRLAHLRKSGGLITMGCIPRSELMATGESESFWPDRTFEIAVRQAVNLGMGLNIIIDKTVETAVRITIEDEKQKSDGDSDSRAAILKRAAEKLGRTKRSLEDYDKKYNILGNLSSSDDP